MWDFYDFKALVSCFGSFRYWVLCYYGLLLGFVFIIFVDFLYLTLVFVSCTALSVEVSIRT